MTYELPAEWRVVPFSQIAEYRLGRTPARKTSRFWADGTTGFPWVSIADLQPFGTVKSTSESVTFDAYKEVFQGQLVPAGTLLMSFKLTIGRTSILDIDAFHNEAIISIYPREGVHREYLKFYLPTIDFADHQDRAVKGQTLNRGKIDRLPVVLPPLDEQIAIANVLEALRSQVENEAAICGKLAALKSATMAKLFREGLRGEPLKQTEIGEIPESWEVKPVSAVSDAVSGGTPSKQRTDWWSGSIPWASPKDMKRLRLRDTEDHITPEAAEAGSRIVPPKTVFIVVRGMVLAKDVPVAITEVPMAFNQDMKALLPSERINPDFLLYALCARKSALIQEIGTSAHGTRRMAGSSVDGLLIPVPKDSEEQRDIAETLHMLDRREEISKERVRCLQALFSSTLHALMTGAIRVKDLDLAEVSDA